MRRFVVIAFLMLMVQVMMAQEAQESQVEKNRVLLLMGSRFEVHVVASSSDSCDYYIDAAIAEISRIERIISSWDSRSETSLINKNAGLVPVKVSPELFDLITRAVAISDMTKGAFDITAVVMSDIWKFDGSMVEMPSAETIHSKISLIDYHQIILNEKDNTVFLPQVGMKIGFGSIGKGYAAGQAAEKLQSLGVKSGLINAGGDLYAWGKPLHKTMWQVGIVDPTDKEKMYAWLDVHNVAVVTSGDYEKRVVFDGKSYSHIIDPRTGYPVANGLHSVTVITHNPELADALATSIFVLGQEVGLYFVNQLEGVDVVLVNDKQEVLTSNSVFLNRVEK